jgi:hypothetical protein
VTKDEATREREKNDRDGRGDMAMVASCNGLTDPLTTA